MIKEALKRMKIQIALMKKNQLFLKKIKWMFKCTSILGRKLVSSI